MSSTVLGRVTAVAFIPGMAGWLAGCTFPCISTAWRRLEALQPGGGGGGDRKSVGEGKSVDLGEKKDATSKARVRTRRSLCDGVIKGIEKRRG